MRHYENLLLCLIGTVELGYSSAYLLLKKLHTVSGLNYEHEVPQNWEIYKVTVRDKLKIDWMEEEL